MDMNTLMSALLNEESIAGLSKKTGASQKDIAGVLTQALPMLLAGANNQANGSTAQSFTGALNQHAANDTTNLASFLQNVDLDDGLKIIGHLLGGQANEQTNAVAQSAGISAKQTKLILAAVAPLLMSLLGKQTQAAQGKEDNIGNLMGSLMGKFDAKDIVKLLGKLM